MGHPGCWKFAEVSEFQSACPPWGHRSMVPSTRGPGQMLIRGCRDPIWTEVPRACPGLG